MVEHLPPYSATEREITGRWTATEKLLEAQLNEQQLLLDQLATWLTKQQRQRDPRIVLPDSHEHSSAQLDPDMAADFAARVLAPHRRRAQGAPDPPRG